MATEDEITEDRFNSAIDYVLNSGALYGFMDTFWKYVDGEITWHKFTEHLSCLGGPIEKRRRGAKRLTRVS